MRQGDIRLRIERAVYNHQSLRIIASLGLLGGLGWLLTRLRTHGGEVN